MHYRQFIAEMSPEVYARLKLAVELGKWPDGRALSQEQRENALQAVIAWDAMHREHSERVGFIDKKHKAGETCDDEVASTLRWIDREYGDE
tara:strand:+ start:4127 stop:4399 length:273 start_codon:yes stop_codon:yes gene_type:complete